MKRPLLRYTIPQLLLLTVVIAVVAMVWSRHVRWQEAEVRYMQLIAGGDSSPETIATLKRLVRRYPQLAQKPGSMEWVMLHADLDTCRYFLQSGANVNEMGRFLGETPLHFAIVTNSPDLARLLFEFSVDVSLRRHTPRPGEVGDTFLHTAARLGNREMCQLLLNHQVPLAVTNNLGQTPLHLAVQWGSPEVVQLLLQQGARCTPDQQGHTPQYFAQQRRAEYLQLGLRPRKVDALIRMLGQADSISETETGSNH